MIVNVRMAMNTVAEVEDVVTEMCDKFCKYPNEEGHEEGWLQEEDSPCQNCPLNRLL